MNSSGRVVGVLPMLVFALVFSLTGSAESDGPTGLIRPAGSIAEEDATLQWVRTIALSTPVNGIIAEVKVNRGDRVRANQVLLRLDNETFRADVFASRARLKQARNNRDEAGRELERTQELYDRTLLSDHDLQLAKIEKDAADADLLSARASLTNAEHDFAHSIIRAPFAAWVLQRNAQPGQTVVSRMKAAPLIVLAEADRMLARSLVSGAIVDNIRRNDKAKVIVAGKTYAGTVSFVALEPEKAGSDRYVVEVVFATKKRMLRVGQPAKVKF